MPNANQYDWQLARAGQRVQIIKSTPNGASLRMGTEVVTSSDGSLAALLGASPGASTAVTTMLEVLVSCWSQKMETSAWKESLHNLLPSFGKNINEDLSLLKKVRERNDDILGFLESC